MPVNIKSGSAKNMGSRLWFSIFTDVNYQGFCMHAANLHKSIKIFKKNAVIWEMKIVKVIRMPKLFLFFIKSFLDVRQDKLSFI